MNTSVSQLLEIERQAQQMLSDAQQYFEQTMQEIQAECQKLQDNYQERAQHRIEQVRQTESQCTDDAITAATARYDRLIRQMNQQYEQDHAAWEDSLFDLCLDSASN